MLMTELLAKSGDVVAGWLEARLPALSPSWWTDQVVGRLTFQQQRLVEEKRLTRLSQLDLAGCFAFWTKTGTSLRVSNHYLARREPGSRTSKRPQQMGSCTRKWPEPTDVYRDADTLERLIAVLDSKTSVVDEVARFKQAQIARLASAAEPITGPTSSAPQPAHVSASSHKFSIGQLVCLKSNCAAVFPVLEVLPVWAVRSGIEYLRGGTKQVYYESQLKPLDEQQEARKVLTTVELSALLSAIQLSSRPPSSIYSLNSGRVRFVPYQYRPVLKLIRADRPRLLVADEVGVGKTIEAGLIIKELQARSDIKSVSSSAQRRWLRSASGNLR